MDGADTRRGTPTTHVVYDEATAILVGDALNTHAFYEVANAPLSDGTKIEIISALSYDGGVGGMVIGQAIDLFFENKKLDISQVEFLHIHKTAKLIATSLKIGAIICDSTDEIKNNLYDFGIDIGLLFQIQDDIIDATMSTKEAGKNTNNDENKNSFVNIIGLEKSRQELQTIHKKLQQKLSLFDDNIRVVLENLMGEYITSV
jgi:farnesyl diphosphate synthase